MEEAASLNDEAHFILVVPMLAAELRQHRIEVRRLRRHADHVRRDVSAPRFQVVDLVGVGPKDLVLRRARFNRMSRLPHVVLDSDFTEVLRDLGLAGDCPIFLRDSKYCHWSSSLISMVAFSIAVPSSVFCRPTPTKIRRSRRGVPPRPGLCPRCTSRACGS